MIARPSSRNVRAALNFAGRAVQAGSDLMLLEIRSSPEIRALYRGTGLDDWAALERLWRVSDLPLWPFPAELAGGEHICDYIHLDKAARASRGGCWQHRRCGEVGVNVTGHLLKAA